MRLTFVAALCASLASAQPSPAQPPSAQVPSARAPSAQAPSTRAPSTQPPSAQVPSARPPSARGAPGKVDLRPALIAEAGIGDVAVYISDDFRKSAPIAPEPLHVIAIQRSNPGDALNSPADDMQGPHLYLRANSGFGAKDLVAVASSRDLIRVFFRGEHRAFAEGFDYPRATLGKAGPEHWARLRSISFPDFSRYLAKNATRQAEGMRWAFGPRIPLAQGHPITLSLGIAAASAERGRTLAVALRGKKYDAVSHEVTLGPGGKALELQARFRFSEALLQRLMNSICADAARRGAECESWSARFDTVTLEP